MSIHKGDLTFREIHFTSFGEIFAVDNLKNSYIKPLTSLNLRLGSIVC